MEDKNNPNNIPNDVGPTNYDKPLELNQKALPFYKSTPFFVGTIVVILLVAVAILFWGKPTQKTSANLSIPASAVLDNITPQGFNPSVLTIKLNQAVEWTNYDTKPHIVASDPYPKDNALAGFKSQPLNQTQTYTFVFNKKGTFTFHDDLNPLTFKGTIIVK